MLYFNSTNGLLSINMNIIFQLIIKSATEKSINISWYRPFRRSSASGCVRGRRADSMSVTCRGCDFMQSFIIHWINCRYFLAMEDFCNGFVMLRIYRPVGVRHDRSHFRSLSAWFAHRSVSWWSVYVPASWKLLTKEYPVKGRVSWRTYDALHERLYAVGYRIVW